jgi:hypothetical protein
MVFLYTQNGSKSNDSGFFKTAMIVLGISSLAREGQGRWNYPGPSGRSSEAEDDSKMGFDEVCG